MQGRWEKNKRTVFFSKKKKNKNKKKNENSTNQIAVILSRNRNFANQVNNEILVPLLANFDHVT